MFKIVLIAMFFSVDCGKFYISSSHYVREMGELTLITALIGYTLTPKGEKMLPEDLKMKIREIVRSKEFRKIAKKGLIEDVVPLMLDKVGMDKLGEVASKVGMNTANIAIIASLYALDRFKEEEGI
ncbi:MAG: hypothetical protein ACXQTS_02970 [Candidatus Methanospirareceae archaeon]